MFPRGPLRWAMAHPEQMTPLLLDVLEKATEDIDHLVEEESYMAHLYAFYLLAQFRETRALPLIIDFFSIPGEVTLDVTGDFVTEDLDRVLASVCGGDTGPIKALVENPHANEFVQTAATRSLVVLVAQGIKTRQEIMDYYQSLFQQKEGLENEHWWANLVSCCCDLYPQEVLEEIKGVFAQDKVDELYIDYDWVEEIMARGKEAALKRLNEDRRYTLIDDTIKEMESWAAFQDYEPDQKVGRNDPCPCGSGEKFKWCCGARRAK